MLPRCLVAGLISTALIVACGGAAYGQDYPNKPIRIVTSAAGGGSDFVARLIAQGISGPMGQNVIVDNRGTNITGELVSKASPDGYTLLIAGSTFMLGPLLQNTPYDPVRDFSPISMLVRSPNILVVHPSVAAKSVKELIALAKARPGVLNYAASGTGGITHLATELFKFMAGVNIVRIQYKGTGPGVIAMLGGEVQLSFANITAVMPYVKLDRLRALAVTSAQPSALAPGLPTVAASGLPGYEASAVDSIFAPAKTPAAIINRLNQETVRVLNRADVKGQLLNIGVEVASSSPEELAAAMKSQIERMGKVIQDAGIKAD